MVSTSKLSWVLPAPRAAARNLRHMALPAALIVGHNPHEGCLPIAFNIRCIKSICKTPATGTAMAKGTAPKLADMELINAPIINITFKIIGAAAPPRYRLLALVTAAQNATMETIGKYGRVMRANVTAS